jgi:preprotein translocase subunit SecE
VEKYVRIGFVLVGVLVWVTLASAFSHLFMLVRPDWDKPLLGPQFSVSTLIAIFFGVGAAVFLWFHKQANQLGLEVASELRNVTWPSWAETRVSTIVVVVTTVVISLILGVFDAVWGAVTSLVYRL